MTTNTKIAWGVMALIIIVLAGLYAYPNAWKVSSPNSASNQTVPSITLQGTVTDVNADKLQISVQTSTPGPVKIATINPATRIEKTISQKNASGVVEKQALIEVNVGDVPKGSEVTVVYQLQKDSVLSGVSRIIFTVEGNIDDYFKAQAASQTPYLKGQVVAIDIAGKILQYKPYLFAELSTTVVSVAIPADIPVYTIDSPTRVQITYARAAATLADVKPGQTIFIQADPTALKANKVVPQAFIILGK